MKKLIAVVLALVLCLSVGAVAMAEGEGSDRYISTQNVNFMSAYPQYTFKMATFGIQYLELNEDGTYRLVDTENSFSGALTFLDDGTYEVVPRGADVRIYTGTYESVSDSGLLLVTLSAPAAVELVSNFSVGQDAGEELDAAGLLEKYGFEETEIMIDEATGVFDYIPVGGQL